MNLNENKMAIIGLDYVVLQVAVKFGEPLDTLTRSSATL